MTDMIDQASDAPQEVQLVFATRGGLEKTKFGGKEFSAKVDEIKNWLIKNWFKDYKISSIELWIQGAVRQRDVLKLLVSFEGSGGVKVTLKPR
jgi:hypothetical protein